MKLDKIRFAKVVSWISRITNGLEFAEDDLIELDNIINIDVQPDLAYPSISDINNLMATMAAGTNKIEAIKLYRKLTGWGVKESKEEVEKYWKAAEVANHTLGDMLKAAVRDAN